MTYLRSRHAVAAPIGAALATLIGLSLLATPALALEPFTDATATLFNPMVTSGVAMGIADLDGDGLDDIVRLHDRNELLLEYQQPDGSFMGYPGFVLADIGSWSLAIADVDGNGYADIYTGGAYDDTKILLGDENGYTLTTLPVPQIFAQCSSFQDIDNNGTVDLLVCNDDGISAPFSGDGMGNFMWEPDLIVAASDPGGGMMGGGDDPNSGNYGIVWSDYDNDGDSDVYIAKCRLGIGQVDDPRRLNVLYRNDGAAGYTQVAADVGLQPQQQSWAFDFGDIDNDGDMDGFLLNHSMGPDGVLSRLYENLGPADVGMFQDITMASGMNDDLIAIDLGIQAHFEDFDNDTFIDLLVTGREGEHRLFFNNGDHTFTPDLDAFPTGGLGIQSAVVGDLNDDGFPDVLAGFASNFNNPSSNPDGLYLNPGNDNNYINVALTGLISNSAGLGARVELHGDWGTQIRDIRAGESYGINNTRTAHFGLGTATSVDSIVIKWPSGQVDTAENPPINLTVNILETCPDVWYPDTDGDGFGDPNAAVMACLQPEGTVEDDTDCDDADETVFPDNPEVCDGIDNDCDGDIDEDFPEVCNGDTGTTGGSGGGLDDTAGSGDATAGSGTGDTDGAGANDGDDGGGCGCRTEGSGSGWAAWALVGFVAWRRRRRDR